MSDELEIRRVDRSRDTVLRNLFEHYLHDMAEWFEFDPGADGRYVFDTGELWDAGVVAYLAYRGEIPIGFALVGSADAFIETPGAFDLREFFVARRHRRSGIGRRLASHVWDAHRGLRLVRVLRDNRPALPFWRGAIAAYTGGVYVEQEREVRSRLRSYFSFDNAR